MAMPALQSCGVMANMPSRVAIATVSRVGLRGWKRHLNVFLGEAGWGKRMSSVKVVLGEAQWTQMEGLQGQIRFPKRVGAKTFTVL